MFTLKSLQLLPTLCTIKIQCVVKHPIVVSYKQYIDSYKTTRSINRKKVIPMIAIQIEDVKLFMNKLLKASIFDDFEVIKVDLSTKISYTIDGTINYNFLDSDEKDIISDQIYIKWLEIKPNILSIIKGSKTPSILKIVFCLSEKSKNALVLKSKSTFKPEDINGFYMNIIFENKDLKIVTGTNYKLFSLDKSIEQYYDQSIIKFLSKYEIPITVIQ